MAVELGSGYDNPTFKTRKVTNMDVSSGDIYENFQRPEQYEQQKPKPNSDVTPKEAAAMMPNVKVHLVLVSVGIVSVLLVSIGFFSWAGWKMNQHDETVTDLGKQNEHLKTENEKLQNETEKLRRHVENLNEKSQNETEKLNQKIQLIQKFNTFLTNGRCNGSECLLCKIGWIFFNESCYYFGETWLTWDESRRFCQFSFADLVVIDNLQEQVSSDTNHVTNSDFKYAMKF
ncbi:C-type lectin domain family 10 member A-like [Poecilia reticulata]|uniref:C-type lectin domain family 10 member A-like n=1 Tax=Poecilia reticulata TaxID=8081 RepID=UPI0007EAF86C|nr:PREDICTED: C-type lectin domain family 10 member A-like [Poecilia reticulata]